MDRCIVSQCLRAFFAVVLKSQNKLEWQVRMPTSVVHSMCRWYCRCDVPRIISYLFVLLSTRPARMQPKIPALLRKRWISRSKNFSRDSV